MPATKVTVIAFDPGKHTGVASFHALRASDGNYYATEYASQTMGPRDHHLELSQFIEAEAKEADELHLVLERFDYRNGKKGMNLQARDYIGIIDLEVKKLWQAGTVVQSNRQTPSTGKAFVKDSNLQKMGLYAGITRHERDVYRHLFWYMIHKANILRDEFLRAGWK